MKVIKTYNAAEKDSIDRALLQKSQKGRWSDWSRVFLLRTSDGRIGMVSLNFFERAILFFHKHILHRPYSKFADIFQTKDIKMLNPSDLELPVKKVNDVAQKQENLPPSLPAERPLQKPPQEQPPVKEPEGKKPVEDAIPKPSQESLPLKGDSIEIKERAPAVPPIHPEKVQDPQSKALDLCRNGQFDECKATIDALDTKYNVQKTLLLLNIYQAIIDEQIRNKNFDKALITLTHSRNELGPNKCNQYALDLFEAFMEAANLESAFLSFQQTWLLEKEKKEPLKMRLAQAYFENDNSKMAIEMLSGLDKASQMKRDYALQSCRKGKYELAMNYINDHGYDLKEQYMEEIFKTVIDEFLHSDDLDSACCLLAFYRVKSPYSSFVSGHSTSIGLIYLNRGKLDKAYETLNWVMNPAYNREVQPHFERLAKEYFGKNEFEKSAKLVHYLHSNTEKKLYYQSIARKLHEQGNEGAALRTLETLVSNPHLLYSNLRTVKDLIKEKNVARALDYVEGDRVRDYY